MSLLGILGIGARGGNGLYTFNGLIDDVHIFNRALSASEVLQIYQHKWADIWKPSLTSYFYPTGWKFYRPSMLGGLRV